MLLVESDPSWLTVPFPNCSVPELITVGPRYVFAAVSNKVPEPLLVKPPVVLLAANVTAPAVPDTTLLPPP